MPTYEYLCKGCGSQFDLYQKLTDPAPTDCPECHGGPVQKVFTSVGIIFKGSGFHVNDYKKPGAKSEAAEGSAEKSGSETDKKSDSSSESKSDSGSEKGSDSKAGTTPEKSSPEKPAAGKSESPSSGKSAA